MGIARLELTYGEQWELDKQRALYAGVLFYGALTVVGLVVLGIVFNVHLASVMGLIAGACAYVTFLLQISAPTNKIAKDIALGFIACSIFAGVGGLCLLLLTAVIA